MENQKDKRTLLRHCDDQNICHCDWRLTLVDCEESVAMYYINIINIILCSLAVIIGIIIINMSFFFLVPSNIMISHIIYTLTKYPFSCT